MNVADALESYPFSDGDLIIKQVGKQVLVFCFCLNSLFLILAWTVV